MAKYKFNDVFEFAVFSICASVIVDIFFDLQISHPQRERETETERQRQRGRVGGWGRAGRGGSCRRLCFNQSDLLAHDSNSWSQVIFPSTKITGMCLCI